MKNEFVGKIIEIKPRESGVSQSGKEWTRQEFVVEEVTETQYKQSACFRVFGDKVNLDAYQVGSVVNVNYDLRAREYNGRWYTDITAYAVSTAQGVQAAPTPTPTPTQAQAPQNDLPF